MRAGTIALACALAALAGGCGGKQNGTKTPTPALGAPQLQTEGRGEREPVARDTRRDGSDNPRGRARNRRVIVTFPR